MAAHRSTGATYPDDPGVSIGLDDLLRFVNEMRALAHDRRGKATLESSQLRLIFEGYGRTRHVRVAADLRDLQTEGDHCVEIVFEVDPTDLPKVLKVAEDLLAFVDG
jgi:hypothetical protein